MTYDKRAASCHVASRTPARERAAAVTSPPRTFFAISHSRPQMLLNRASGDAKRPELAEPHRLELTAVDLLADR
jgi:hypothetical protein